MALQGLPAGGGMRIPVISHRRCVRDITGPLVPEQLLDHTPRWTEYQRRTVRLEGAVLDCCLVE